MEEPTWYSLTEHAAARLRERGIRREWVEHTLLQPRQIEPDSIDPTLEHRINEIPELDNRVLRVILRPGETLRIISAFFDRRMKGKL